jgi:hypothetical protein
MAKHLFYTDNIIEGEIWKDIEGYELYKVSNLGRILSLPRPIECNLKHSKYRVSREKIIKTHPHKGYSVAILINSGKRKRFYVHRLVTKAFLLNPENKPEVNHKDFNKRNNNVENLEWCTSRENYIHAVKGGKNLPPKQKQYKIHIRYIPPAGEKAVDAKSFHKYDLDGNYIEELKGLSEHSRRICGKRGRLSSSIKDQHAFHGFRYSYTKADKIPVSRFARTKMVRDHEVTPPISAAEIV